jgi:excisionase family DNA binding protein
MESRAQDHGGGWLDVRDAAAHLACSTKRIYDLVAQRRVRFARGGRRLLFRVEWLDAMVIGQAPGSLNGETIVGAGSER